MTKANKRVHAGRVPFSSQPDASGLYDPRFEHDACGVSFVADIKGRPSHAIVATALGALCNMDHRGAQGAEANTGDGAGILMQVPDAFLRAAVYFPSLSCRTLVYKGMLTTPQLGEFFPELSDPRIASALALVHSRFSTNTFPSWPLAHPYRMIAHNGEINTLQGNRNWMRAREALMHTPHMPNLERAFPIITRSGSDTASFDECLELLHLAGRPIWHAVLMMIPEAWENHASMSAEKRAFYRFHSSLMEPWDGPASIAFTDGTVIGAVLDRNGLRPSRYWRTDDDRVIMASEAGVVDVDPARVVRKGRLQPGRIFLVDTAKGRIVGDREIKEELAGAQPDAEWLEQGVGH